MSAKATPTMKAQPPNSTLPGACLTYFQANLLFFKLRNKSKKASDKTKQKQPRKPKPRNINCIDTESVTYEAPVEHPVDPPSFANRIF